MNDYEKSTQAAARYVQQAFTQRAPAFLHYHDLQHTQQVVHATQEMTQAYNLSDKERSIAEIAAWFHDIGYLEDHREHVPAGIEMARNFLEKQPVSDDFIEGVAACIRATDWPQRPQGRLEEILCDADMSHLAQDGYLTRAQGLRQEINEQNGQKISKRAWARQNQKFYEKHRYFTDYAQTHYEPGKQKNYAQLVAQIEADEKERKKKKKKEVKSISSREAGVLFRILFRNHIDLSSIADTKANIMISVNSILLSVLVTVLFRNLDDYPALWLPSAILATVCLLAIVFAVLATLPRVTNGTFRKEDVEKNQANLLFFGNFHRMAYDDFQWGIRRMIKNDALVYDSLTRDLYLLGKVLHRKYSMLRRSYLVFVVGWVVSIVAFVLAAFYNARLL
ncbi:MAG: Pycsar system effector family protein [Bacteroidota bacterium]